jgi:hypothetical protein
MERIGQPKGSSRAQASEWRAAEDLLHAVFRWNDGDRISNLADPLVSDPLLTFAFEVAAVYTGR